VTDGPRINVDEFRHRPVNELAALLPDKQAVKAAIEDLQDCRRRNLDRTRFCTAKRVPTFLIQPALNTAPPRGSSAGCKLGATTGTFLTFMRRG
jgi:hypothetical protein